MKTAALFVIFAAASASLFGQPMITAEPHGTVYLDDTIVVKVTFQADVGGTVRLRGENVNIEGSWGQEVETRNNIVQYTQVYTATPNAPGPAWVEGYVTQMYKPPSDPFSRITFNVIPDLARVTDDPAKIFASQRAANRPLFYVRSQVSAQRAYVGQRVEVLWQAITAEETIQPQMWRPPLKESDYDTVSWDHERIQSAAGGMIAWRTPMAHIALTSWSPGVLHIPDALVTALQPSPGGKQTFIHRWTTSVDLEFVEPPAQAANLPIGKFNIKCRAANLSGYWPEFSAEVSGDGYVKKAGPPHFDFQPAVTIVPRVGTILPAKIEWLFAVHSRAEMAELPPVTFDYFDPEAGEVRHATCMSTRAKRYFFQAQETDFVARRVQVNPKKAAGVRWIAGFAALFGVAMVTMAARP
jgi:hypothetical protein